MNKIYYSSMTKTHVLYILFLFLWLCWVFVADSRDNSLDEVHKFLTVVVLLVVEHGL